MNDKPKELEEHSAQIFELGCMERPVYLKEDVDAVIAGLKQKLQDQCMCCPVKMQEDDVVAEKDKKIAELKERSQWHRQKDKDIYFECGKHWGVEYIIKMKDGTTHLAYGGCDEGGDGSVSTYLHFQDDDYEWEYDDIDIWYEIPDHEIIGNIKEDSK